MVKKMLKINKDKILSNSADSTIVLPVPPQKMNLKIHRADLKFIDELALKIDTTRSAILNNIIRKVLIEKLKTEVTEFDSQVLLAVEADKLSSQNIIDGCNDLEESWIFEVARAEIKNEIFYKYNNFKLSEQDQYTDLLSKEEIELEKHSDEHNFCKQLIEQKLVNKND
jgi:hypothetical protein